MTIFEISNYENIDINEEINDMGLPTPQDYNAFFHNMAQYSINELNAKGLEVPIGCGTMDILQVPGLNPDIPFDDEDEIRPYIELTNRLFPKIVAMGAKFIQYFLEIVNHPPFAERVAIVQWERNDRPVKFAFFSRDKKKHCIRYFAEWATIRNGYNLARELRQKYSKLPQNLSVDRPAYIFIQFGPSDIGPKDGHKNGRKMRDCSLMMTMGGQPFGEPINLEESYDPEYGIYYWGSFQPENCSNDVRTLEFVISGTDQTAHLERPQNSGNILDSYPATVPIVDAEQSPDYPWKDYNSGEDKNHSIKVSPPLFKVTVFPPSGLIMHHPSSTPFVYDITRRRVINTNPPDWNKIIVEVEEFGYDCSMEPIPGFTNCPVTWALQNEVKRVSAPTGTGSPSDFNIEIEFTSDTRKATIIVNPDWNNYDPGIYHITLTYTFGSGFSGNKVLPVHLL